MNGERRKTWQAFCHRKVPSSAMKRHENNMLRVRTVSVKLNAQTSWNWQ
jgi:hypothetical protein